MIVEPRVTLIAHTQLARTGGIPNVSEWMEVQKASTDEETLTTFAGRACYQSFHRPNPKTADDGDYLRRTVFEQGHGSIAEHASATFYITGVSRAFTHELVRHRHLSFSQLSQRFVDESDPHIVVPPAMLNEYGSEQKVKDFTELVNVDEYLRSVYRTEAQALEKAGYTRKQAREAARAVLPNMAETRIVVTGNLRAWKQVIDRRIADDADREMQEVMGMVRDELAKHVSPVLFAEAKSNDINNYRRDKQ